MRMPSHATAPRNTSLLPQILNRRNYSRNGNLNADPKDQVCQLATCGPCIKAAHGGYTPSFGHFLGS